MGGLDPAASSAPATDGALSQHSPVAAKIALFRSLFRGREDVYPRRFESRKTGKSGYATAFLTVLEEYLALPCGATVLGEAVVVEKIDLSGADELIAICRHRGKRQKVGLLDLELPVPRAKGVEWVAAYRCARRR